MQQSSADFTSTFRLLCDAAEDESGDPLVRELFTAPAVYDEWAAQWRKRLDSEPGSSQEHAAAMRRVNPAFIPRNHLVEAVIESAVSRQDFQPFQQLLDVTSHPYEDRPDLERYSAPARPEQAVLRTFCGT
jgi:uncharacterized protein YdiU (UPF0061 family)